MILKASQRAGGMQLAHHLLKIEDNEHVEIHEISGFVSDDLIGAFKEAHAVSLGTRCKQFLFSLSLSPPEMAKVPIEVFEQAIAEIETRMNLTGQPRAIVFHEKEGRRHAHCVWSRIDVDQMKAINLPHYKLKLRDISRQLYLDHGWQMPRGLMNSKERNPLNFTMAEWQQAKRAIKKMFKECWAVSDSAVSFAHALEDRGYYLAKGDRRGHVAIDWRGEVYAISRWVEVKAKDVRAKLIDTDTLPSVDETKTRIAERLSDKLRGFIKETEQQFERRQNRLNERRLKLVARHRQERERLRQNQAKRTVEETKARAARLPKGLKALWFRVTGKYRRIAKENELDTQRCDDRDRVERQRLIETQLRERRSLQHEILQLGHHTKITMDSLIPKLGSNESQSTKTKILRKRMRRQNF
jgi:hypothetical protein